MILSDSFFFHLEILALEKRFESLNSLFYEIKLEIYVH